MNKDIILGGGCFWCTEAIYKYVNGVEDVVPGYIGGDKENPTYEEVCSGTTGHAEVVKINFDSSKISLDKLLEIFFKTHDPTTLNRQGNDVGTQYRSVIFYDSNEQQDLATNSKNNFQKNTKAPIVTEIVKIDSFYRAEEYHQNYLRKNNLGLCDI